MSAFGGVGEEDDCFACFLEPCHALDGTRIRGMAIMHHYPWGIGWEGNKETNQSLQICKVGVVVVVGMIAHRKKYCS